jgi:hypothetical protein
MNYVDTIDLSGVNTPPANAEEPPAQTLNEEVNQVLGQLNSFWGGFRKQVGLNVVHRNRLRHLDIGVFDCPRVKLHFRVRRRISEMSFNKPRRSSRSLLRSLHPPTLPKLKPPLRQPAARIRTRNLKRTIRKKETLRAIMSLLPLLLLLPLRRTLVSPLSLFSLDFNPPYLRTSSRPCSRTFRLQ